MRHVLVVDDEQELTFLFQAYLEDAGYRVTVANDGLMGLAADERDPADAVITDLTMPRMNGRDMLLRLRERRPQVPAIVVTGYSAAAAGLGSQRTVVLAKPVALETVARRLADLLADQQTAQGLR
ncbi:response regulator [Ramlibacter tataouinensis]|uniref:Candidate response regulator, CheY n=1 Tax=Ramlibacter tataouinensis (strain ATCC BAA-407 / DSM 14655 / LMG 21543 / TTB310) TaxID=365046 RepID=F5Y2K3_RAMTT|nr:response regulator [Ramlibacter tataouinensis]AEG92366.1 candidate response regulator, CheY [Ramlibacter tataouinensis TTB310]